jgi:hypothetical protein
VTFPLAQKVDHYPWSADGTDELGNVVNGWAETPTTVDVYGYTVASTERLSSIGSGSSALTPGEVNAAGEKFDAAITSPPNWVPSIRDRVGLGGDVYEVTSLRLQCTGFHGWSPGNVVLLRRVEGI